MSKIAQDIRVVKYIEQYGSITSLEAIHYLGITRLSAVIFRLIKKGYIVRSEFVLVRNRFNELCRVKRYWIETI